MQDTKIPGPILIGGAIFGVVIVIGLIALLFLGGKGGGSTPPEESTNASTEKKVAGTPHDTTQQKTSSDLTGMVVKDSVLRSMDHGETFETYFTIATTSKIGLANVLSISFHPLIPDRIIVTTNEDGLYVNEGRKNSWAPIVFPPKKIYSFILDRTDPNNRVFASGVVEKNGRVFRTDNAAETWRAVYAEPGEGTYVSALAQHTKTGNIIFAGTSGGTIVKSVDNGNTWRNVGENIGGTILNFTFDTTDKNFHYLLAKGIVYHTKTGGLSWMDWEQEKAKEVQDLEKRASEYAKSGDTTNATRLRRMASDLRKQNTMDKRPPGIIFIVADPNVKGRIYASAGKGLWRSNDYGKYWKKLNIIESAEQFPIRSVAVNPKNSNELVFVSGKTFYRSTDKGETWSLVPLNNSRNASFVAYDPFDPALIFIGLSSV